ncbi:hypothetical protein [Mycobacterium szulgai]|uniref:Uncharacterized protein n=1 Tax=Mycobacterium szulgai TaxID=1787 RepID=A0A1X2DLG3_MYCSZ|nr:hypothetical protein [Mycobacterium szulgai]ORW89012.1 hypothetical protein AWC27_13060 [Mycobacterium szulgai]
MRTKKIGASRPRGGMVAAAGLIAFAGLMTAGVGNANAATIQTEGSYPSHAACMAAGPGVQATTAGGWNNYWCVPDRTSAGTWRLVLSN